MKTHRLRWLIGSIDANTLGHLSESMLADQYGPSQPVGFRLHEVRKTYIEGIFIERVEYEKLVLGPDGENIKLPRIEFNQTRFRVSLRAPQVELTDPPRSSKLFLMALAKHARYSIAIQNMSIDLEKWLAQIESRAGRLSVNMLDIGNIEVGSSALARLIVSGAKNLQEKSMDILGHRRYLIQKIGFSWQGPHGQCACDLYHSGGVFIRAGRFDNLLPILRDSLRTTLESTDSQHGDSLAPPIS